MLNETQLLANTQEEPPAGDDDAKGVEMEGDFDGSMHDIPPNPEVTTLLIPCGNCQRSVTVLS